MQSLLRLQKFVADNLVHNICLFYFNLLKAKSKKFQRAQFLKFKPGQGASLSSLLIDFEHQTSSARSCKWPRSMQSM